MFKDFMYHLLWTVLEIIGVSVVGCLVFIFIENVFAKVWAVIGIALIFYFFSPIIKPYIEEFRRFIYSKITGKTSEED